ncbi:MAG: hypothetical protein NTX66_03545 [Candidatus Falkowbacteria bacterium]|nr:hypothetical protein [Candidatus Falkowbacteria bacterium]
MEKDQKNQAGDTEEVAEEVIIIENPEVIDGTMLQGEIVKVGDGFIFIDHVRRGYQTVPTNGDVFCPVPKDSNYKVGQLVQFSELNQDRDRVGKFRTENISLVNTDLDVNTPEGRIGMIAKLSETKSPYHQLKKIIAEGDIEKAKENKPLVEFVQQVAWLLNQEGGYQPEHISRMAEEFVAKTFAMLGPLGVKCSIQGDVDLEAEEEMIKETAKLYEESGLSGQAESLKKEYAQFLAVRNAFTLMSQNNLLNYWSVIDQKHLPELTYAFPVCYIYRKAGLDGLERQEREDDPRPDETIKFFSDCVGSQEYAWFFQIYNRRTRPLARFNGKDIMPPALVKIMNKAKENFDYIAIMTPYHDQASREWSDPNWLRNIDPIMVGFLKDLPYMFVLGRWSGTGIFPLLLDCIADTTNHLRINKHLLGNFIHNSWWYKGKKSSNNDEVKDILSNSEMEKVLIEYTDRLLKAYDNGLLFQFLRGELKEDPDYKF